MHLNTYLALGDSYTIGEAVPFYESFPSQAVQLLREKGLHLAAPEVLARTGWTTDELLAAMKSYRFLPKYDFVTLLIGVNNQYRGQDVIEYKEGFETVLKEALRLANQKKEHVAVLSIPDYGVTPFSRDKDPKKISAEVDVFNKINRSIALQYKVAYIDITPGSREAAHDASLLSGDGLHPSRMEYAKWAGALAGLMGKTLK